MQNPEAKDIISLLIRTGSMIDTWFPDFRSPTHAMPRILVGAHWPMDIAAGAFLGYAIGLAGILMACCFNHLTHSELGARFLWLILVTMRRMRRLEPWFSSDRRSRIAHTWIAPI